MKVILVLIGIFVDLFWCAYYCGPIQQFESEIGFDLVLLLNLVEHVDDPLAVFEHLRGIPWFQAFFPFRAETLALRIKKSFGFFFKIFFFLKMYVWGWRDGSVG